VEKTLSQAPLEEELVSSPLIEQVMLVGQDQRQLSGLGGATPRGDVGLGRRAGPQLVRLIWGGHQAIKT
jgi:long-chain acyl-CoA synthetase